MKRTAKSWLMDACAGIKRVTEDLAGIRGIRAIALRGSQARGTATSESDIDFGVYYRDADRPDFAAVLAAARVLDDRGEPDGYGAYGEWGPWINGGVWLRVGGHKVDILLREIERIDRVITDCAAGRIEVAYQPGHPHAFVSAIYPGEAFHSQILHDPDGELARLKARTDPYPPALGDALVQRFGWEAGFSLATARGAAARGDALYVHGCLFRAVACLVQVVHARNARYLLNEKGALGVADTLPIRPERFRERVEGALGLQGAEPRDLQRALAVVDALRSEALQA